MKRTFAALIAIALLAASARADFAPLATGPSGALNSENGDGGFLVEQFANATLSGEPASTRLETTISLPPAKGARSLRWTTALVPRRTGSHAFALRSTGPATLKIDGKTVVTAKGDGSRATGEAALAANKSYAVVIELRDPKGTATLAAEWSAPSADAMPSQKQVAAPVVAAPRVKIGAPVTLKNDAYSLASSAEGVLTLTELATGAQATFAPDVSVVFQPGDTGKKLDAKGSRYVDDTAVGGTNYIVPAWDKETDFLVAAQPRTTLRPTAATNASGTVRWKFPDQPGYTLAADVALPAGTGEPTLALTLTPKQAGQFSIGYVGAPAIEATACDWIWQPLVWTGKRFPNRSYLTSEYELPIPAVMVGNGGVAIGVAADAREMPFRMPTYGNSRFGVVLRDDTGAMRPQIFAPLLGTADSQMKPGKPYAFTLRLIAKKGDWYAAYKHLAQSLYAFGDQRESGVSSLNTTIDNMLALICDDRYSYWHARYKTWGYQNDGGPDAGRQQSAADALSLALVCDDRAMLTTRAIPTLEYMLSRKGLSTKFSAADFLGGFVRSAPSDLSAAFRLTGGRSTAIRDLLGSKSGPIRKPKPDGSDAIDLAKDQLGSDLSNYALTGDRAFLESAKTAADAYIALRVAKPAANFDDVGSSFWTELSPAYDMLFELFALTNEPKYRDAAAASLREYSGFVYLVPPIPAGTVTVNPGGKFNGQPVPEETVPAWRVAANGLAAECAGTAHSHRGVFMASYASYMARLGAMTNDTLLRDIARSAIVGRYANYPSYAYRGGYTTVFEKANYPLKTFEEIKKFTSAHYNHLVPMAAFLVDYLVSETAARSGGAVDFPADYTNTGAYFRNRVYGARSGTFYDEHDVNLWLPRGLVTSDTIQLNVVSGYGNGKLYLALANQSAKPVTATLTIDPKRVDLSGSHAAKLWLDNKAAPAISVTDGKLRVTVSPKGLTCVAIERAAVQSDVTAAMTDPDVAPLPAGSRQTVTAPFGDVTATALRLGKGLTSVHVFTTAGPDAIRDATLVSTIDGKTARVPLKEYPFEATVPVVDAATEFACTIETTDAGGKAVASPQVSVKLREPAR